MPESPLMLLLAVLPAVLAGALGAGLLACGRARALAATLLALGLALCTVLLLMAAYHGLPAWAAQVASPPVLIGLPLAVFATSHGVVARRVRLPLWRAVAWGLAGAVVLYALGGAVLMLSACAVQSGGC